MKTDDLIRALAADTTAEPSPLVRWPLLGFAAALSALGLWLTIGPRPDLGHALTSAVPLMRHALTLALFILSLRAALTLTRPEGTARLWPLALPVLAALALVLWAFSVTPQEGWAMAWRGKTQWACLISIPLLSIAPVIANLSILRLGASSRPALSGALAGLAGGGLGAAIYALHCTEDSPLFYVSWYGLAILAVTVVSAMAGSRVLRW